MNKESRTFKNNKLEALVSLLIRVSFVGFPFIAIALCFGFYVPFFYKELAETVLVSKLTFVSIGLLFSIFQLFLGVLLALIGVTAVYDIDAEFGPTKIKLISASPGILLIICANFLFAFSLMRTFEVTQTKLTDNTTTSNTISTPSPLNPGEPGTKGP